MSESKPCRCNIVFDGEAWSILYCPLHESAPDGLKLAQAVLSVAVRYRGVRPTQRQWENMMKLARRVVEAAGEKKEG